MLPGLSLLSGYLSLASQIVLMREYFAQCYGSEISWIAFLCAWLIWTGLGASFPVRSSTEGNFCSELLTGQSVIAVLILVCFRSVRGIQLVLPGEPISLTSALIMPFISLAPLCVLNGFVFRLLTIAAINSQFCSRGPSIVYASEAVGSMFAGVILRFWAILEFPVLTILMIHVSLTAALSAILIKKNDRRVCYMITALIAAVLCVSPPMSLNSRFNALEWGKQKPIATRDSAYGRIVIAQYEEVSSLFINHSLIAHSFTSAKSEEMAHVPLALLHKTPNRVLVIEGGFSGLIHEISRHPVKHIDVVFRDFEPLKLIRDTKTEELAIGFEDPRVSLECADPYTYLATHQDYDLIILDLPNPLSVAAARLFSVEFLARIAQSLSPHGIAMSRLDLDDNYLNRESRRYAAIVVNSFRSAFGANLRVLAGETLDIIASNSALPEQTELSSIILQQLKKTRIDSFYVSEGYLPFRCDSVRCNRLESMLVQENAPTSSLFEPHVLCAFAAAWLVFSGTSPWIFGLFFLFLAILGITIVKLHATSNTPHYWFVGLSVGTIGFSQMAITCILLIILQVYYGDGYLNIGILLSTFSCGLAIGSVVMTLKRFSVRYVLQLAHFAFLVIALYCVRSMIHEQSLAKYWIFLSSFLAGVVGGASFSAWSLLHPKLTGVLYAIDLIGSAIGALCSVGLLLYYPKMSLIIYGIIIFQVMSLLAAKIYFHHQINSGGV